MLTWLSRVLFRNLLVRVTITKCHTLGNWNHRNVLSYGCWGWRGSKVGSLWGLWGRDLPHAFLLGWLMPIFILCFSTSSFPILVRISSFLRHQPYWLRAHLRTSCQLSYLCNDHISIYSYIGRSWSLGFLGRLTSTRNTKAFTSSCWEIFMFFSRIFIFRHGRYSRFFSFKTDSAFSSWVADNYASWFVFNLMSISLHCFIRSKNIS